MPEQIFLLSCQVGRAHKSSIRRHGLVIGFFDASADSNFLLQLKSRDEKVLKWVPVFCVDFVHQDDQLSVLKTFVSKELSDVGEVFLFDITVVVLLIGSGSCKNDLLPMACELEHFFV